MSDAYRVRLKKPRRRYRAYVFLVLGALLLYAGTLLEFEPSMRVESRAAGSDVLVTREEELPGERYWLVSLFSDKSEAVALAEAARYVARGAAGWVLRDGSEYRAVGACYESEAEAGEAASKLRKGEAAGAFVFSMDALAVTIRVTATQAQLGALLDADKALRGSVWEIEKIARSIDAGESDSLGARGALFSVAAGLAGAREELSRQTAGESDPATENLLSLFAESESELDALSRSSSLTRLELSGRARLAQIRCAERLCAYRKGLLS